MAYDEQILPESNLQQGHTAANTWIFTCVLTDVREKELVAGVPDWVSGSFSGEVAPWVSVEGFTGTHQAGQGAEDTDRGHRRSRGSAGPEIWGG